MKCKLDLSLVSLYYREMKNRADRLTYSNYPSVTAVYGRGFDENSSSSVVAENTGQSSIKPVTAGINNRSPRCRAAPETFSMRVA